jgi:hypothetical protein
MRALYSIPAPPPPKSASKHLESIKWTYGSAAVCRGRVTCNWRVRTANAGI